MSTKFLFLESMEILSTIPQYYTLLKVFAVLWLLWFLAKKHYQRENAIATEEELQKKLSEWRPEPLIPDIPEVHPSLKPLLVSSRVGKRIVVNSKDCLNLGTHNYLGMTENKDIENKAVDTVRNYGVGSCGPRGFYGTVDVHLELEQKLAQYTETEEAIIYSYGFSTIASAIPAYCKRKDLVFVDEKVNFAIQKGLDTSRSDVIYFKHNDVQDLHNLLMKQHEKDKKNWKKASKIRRFLIVEGIYINTGEICPLPELVVLCRKYKLRMFVDESISFGTLGAHGKGVTEHFGVPRHEIDMIMGSMENAIGSIGGFCVGASFIIEHQRLSGLGYCFSASLPPLLTTAALTALDIMENNPQLFQILKDNCIAIASGLKQIPYLKCSSFPESPVKHVYLNKELDDYNKEQEILAAISMKCIDNNLAVITPPYLEAEKQMPRPSLRICVSVLLDQNDIEFAITTLKKCTKEILTDRKML